MFTWVLQRLDEHGLIQGDRIGVDASTMEANVALRAIVHRDSGEDYREMLHRLAKESGIATPTADDLIRLDRNRTGKRLSNADWASPSDPEAKTAKMPRLRTGVPGWPTSPSMRSISTPGPSPWRRFIQPIGGTPRPCRARSRPPRPIWPWSTPRRRQSSRPSWSPTRAITHARG